MAPNTRPIHAGPRSFDDAKLQTMVEPLTVRIDRLTQNKRQPIPVWPSDSGQENGAGFTKDEVRRLDTFLVTQWAGGGLFEVSVTDSSDPPVNMKWQPWWDLSSYPELIPPPLQDARSPDAPPAMPAPPQPSGTRMPPFIPPQPSWTPPNPYATPHYPLPPQPPYGTPQYAHWRDDADKRERDAEVRRLREEAERRDREAIEARHKAEIERERQANDARFTRLENMIAGFANSIKDANAAPRGPSPEMLAMEKQMVELREATRKAEERAENARREADADRREALLRDHMRQQSEEAKRALEATQRQIETMQQQFQATITQLTAQMANASSKSDPLVAFMQENARNHADVLKEMARENNAAMQRFQAFMMNPVELMRLARESQDGIEKAIERTTRFTDNVVSMQQKVLENALNMQPQSNGVIDAVTQGMNNVKEFLERFVGGKSREAIAKAQADAEIARAQAHAFEVHARATNPTAFAPPPGLAGPTVEPTSPVVDTPTPSVEPATQPATTKRVERLWGRTDQEWFGQALDDIEQLRFGVTQFVLAVADYNRRGVVPAKIEDIPGTHPASAAQAISMGMAMAMQHNVVIPAMVELLNKGLVNEFMTVLLPDATPEYRNEVIKALQSGNEGDQDDDDEDGDPDERTTDATPPPPPATVPEPRSGRNGRGRARA